MAFNWISPPSAYARGPGFSADAGGEPRPQVEAGYDRMPLETDDERAIVRAGGWRPARCGPAPAAFHRRGCLSGTERTTITGQPRTTGAQMRRVITFGTFDVLHVGHILILERARALGDQLVVGVSSDALNYSKKQRYPIYRQADRVRIIESLRCVDQVFVEESLELKTDYIRQHDAQVLVMGDDWKGRFDHLSSLCEVIYLPRTPSISTTEIIEIVRRGS